MTIFFLQSKFKPKLGIRITIIFFYVNPKPTSLRGFKELKDNTPIKHQFSSTNKFTNLMFYKLTYSLIQQLGTILFYIKSPLSSAIFRGFFTLKQQTLGYFNVLKLQKINFNDLLVVPFFYLNTMKHLKYSDLKCFHKFIGKNHLSCSMADFQRQTKLKF